MDPLSQQQQQMQQQHEKMMQHQWWTQQEKKQEKKQDKKQKKEDKVPKAGTSQEIQFNYKKKNPLLMALLSLIIPGLGQLILGETKKAILFFSLYLLVGIYIGILNLLIWIYGIYDAYVTAKKYNEKLPSTSFVSGMGTQQSNKQFPGQPAVTKSSLPAQPGESGMGTQQSNKQFPGQPLVTQSSLPPQPGESGMATKQNNVQFPGQPVVTQSSLPAQPGESGMGTQQSNKQFPGQPVVTQSSLPVQPGESGMTTKQNNAQFPNRQEGAQQFPLQSGIASIKNPTTSLNQKPQDFNTGIKKTSMQDNIPKEFQNGTRGQARNVVDDSYQQEEGYQKTAQIKVLTFNLVIEDRDGNMIEAIPVELSSKKSFTSRIKEGDHIILNGKRNKNGIILAKKVYNISTHSIVKNQGKSQSSLYAFLSFLGFLTGSAGILLVLFGEQIGVVLFLGWLFWLYYGIFKR